MVGVLCVYYDAYACRATTVRLKVTVNSFLDSTLVPKRNVCVLFRETVARFRSPSPRDRWRSRDRRDRRDRLAIVAIVGDRLAIELDRRDRLFQIAIAAIDSRSWKRLNKHRHFWSENNLRLISLFNKLRIIVFNLFQILIKIGSFI